MSHQLKIKLSSRELPELVKMYAFFIPLWISLNPHESLLLENAIIFSDRLARSIRPEAKSYHIKMNSAEALAFMQWWCMIEVDLSQWAFAFKTMSHMICEIDKHSLQHKQLTEAA